MRTNAKSGCLHREAIVATGGLGSHLANPAPVPTSGKGPHAADRLVANQQLASGDFLIAPNGRVRLVMQTDGNLVVYCINGAPLWATNTMVAWQLSRA